MIRDAALDDLRKAIDRGEIIHPLLYGIIVKVLDERKALIDRCCIEAQRHLKTSHERDRLEAENKRLHQENAALRMSVRALGEEVNTLAGPQCALCDHPVNPCMAEVGATGLLYHRHCYREVTNQGRP